ncbi:hypothetical protein [Sulfuricystis multivorans]|uniref:hypothetical protein n=1 Tax=Sulfuricystis multivorans TaxID=2211108 RepID=UPI000F821DDD|nr:hypothetical protein [Sulfuricystis multivorans]
MKPLAIDFAPPPPVSTRMRWIAGAFGMLVVIIGASVWGLTSPVEASHMAQAQPPSLPASEAVQAADRAIRELNLPWPEVLAVLADHFGTPHAAVLERAEADIAHASVRLSGEARSQAVVQALPGHLRSATPIAEATLLGVERSEDPDWPVRFSLELHIREAR